MTMRWTLPTLFALLAFFVLYPKLFPVYTITYGMNITIVDGQHAGLDVRNDVLYFGKVSRGGEGMRQLLIKNHETRALRVTFSSQGPFASYLYVPEEKYMLQPQEEHIFNVFVRVPQEAPLGSFVGKLTVSFWKS